MECVALIEQPALTGHTRRRVTLWGAILALGAERPPWPHPADARRFPSVRPQVSPCAPCALAKTLWKDLGRAHLCLLPGHSHK